MGQNLKKKFLSKNSKKSTTKLLFSLILLFLIRYSNFLFPICVKIVFFLLKILVKILYLMTTLQVDQKHFFHIKGSENDKFYYNKLDYFDFYRCLQARLTESKFFCSIKDQHIRFPLCLTCFKKTHSYSYNQ